ncbi:MULTISPECIES: hypothetical protein [Actinosynnema]|uniref:hypothetical protein n=1 Tax=Actinosynnema TaxID=40566 RepID=UPI0020A4D422|nr:hypothetical protein [Actinosynnema pretiosum]
MEHDGFREFAALVGATGDRVEEGVRDEHVRHAVYLEALAAAGPGADVALIGRVLDDPDRVVAEASVVRHVDRVAAGAGAGFGAWADAVRQVVGERAFPLARIEEWRLFLAVRDGEAVDGGRLVAASDWLQRKVVEELAVPAALEALAEGGRTKRVRNQARNKLGKRR